MAIRYEDIRPYQPHTVEAKKKKSQTMAYEDILPYDTWKAYKTKTERPAYEDIRPEDYSFDVDQNYINSFIESSNQYLSQMQDLYNSNDYDALTKGQKPKNENRDELLYLRAFANANKQVWQQEDYDQFIEMLDAYQQDFDTMETALRDRSSAIKNSFESKDAYDNAVYTYTMEDKYKDLTFAQMQEAIAGLDRQKGEYAARGEMDAYEKDLAWLNDYMYTKPYTTKEDYKAAIDSANKYLQEEEDLKEKAYNIVRGKAMGWYDNGKSPKDYEREAEAKKEFYEEKKGQISAMEAALKAIALDDYTAEINAQPDFEKYAKNTGKNAPKVKPTMDKAEKVYTILFSSDDLLRQFAKSADIYDSEVYSKCEKMTSDERNAFLYLWNKEGKKAAEKYLERLDSKLNKKYTIEEAIPNAEEFARKYPLLAQGGVLLASLIDGKGAFEDLGNAIMGKEIDIYSPAHMAANVSAQMKYTLGEMVGDWEILGGIFQKEILGTPLGTILYNTHTSMSEMGIGMAFGKGFGLDMKGTKALTQFLLSSSAATDQIINAKQRGLEDTQAVLLGVASGVTEWLTEKYSIEAFLGNPKRAAAYLAKNVVSEGSEEAAADVLNTLADVLIAGDQSQFKQTMQMQIEQGATEKDAFAYAFNDLLQQMGSDALAGALAGLGMGGIGIAGNRIGQSVQLRRTGKQMIDEGQIDTLLKTAQGLDKDSQAYQLAETLAGKASEKISAGELGRLAELTTAQMQKEQTGAAITGRLQNMGVAQAQAQQISGAMVKEMQGETLNRAEKKALQTQPALDVYAEIRKGAEWLPAASISMPETAADNSSAPVNANTQQSGELAAAGNGFAPVNAEVQPGIQAGDVTDGAATPVVLNSNGAAAGVQRIAGTENGSLQVRLTDGRTVDVKEVDFRDPQTAELYAAAGEMELNAAGANALVNMYIPQSGTDIYLYARAFKSVYNQALAGLKEADIRRLAEPGLLNPAQMKAAIAAGQAERQNMLKAYKKQENKITAGENGGAKYDISKDPVVLTYQKEIDTIAKSDDVQRKGQYIEVSSQTPSILIEQADAENLPLAILFDTAYLETRHDGKLPGNYHNLGADTMKKLPALLANPDYIVKLENGRLNVIVHMETSKGKQLLVSIELAQHKQIGGKFKKYNLVITAFSAKSGYVQKIIQNPKNKVKYRKETNTQGTDRLHKGSDGINVLASNDIVPQKAQTVNIQDMQNKGKYTPQNSITVSKGRVINQIRTKHLSEKQRAAVEFIKKFSAVTGVNFVLFESDGTGYNGAYADGTIWLDINAGNVGEQATLRTMAHELTHYIQDSAPAQYEALKDFLLAELGKNDTVHISDLIQEKIRRAEANGHSLSTVEAVDEVVADACEMMLQDGSAIRRLAKANLSLAKRIQAWIDDFIALIKKAFDGVKSSSIEYAVLQDVQADMAKLQSMWNDALTAAVENRNAKANKNTAAENGGVNMYDKEKMNGRYQVGSGRIVTFTHDTPFIMNSVSQTEEDVKGSEQKTDAIGAEIDTKTESVAPAVMYSERSWRKSDYVQEREKAAREIAQAIHVSEEKAKEYIDSINSIAKMIAEDRTRLDYFSSPLRSSFISNVEYGGSFDFSTLCKKRRLLTGTFTAIQKALPNTALTADEILDIRNRMKAKGLEVSCGLCYVEGSRANMGQFVKEFLNLYKKYYPDAWQPNMADINTPDGIEWVRINHPECYEQYEYFWNHYGTLKSGDQYLFASQQKPKLYQLHTEYKGEILQKFKNDGNIETKNRNGGIRMQSFSDFEIVHLIDTMQIIMDMARLGLAGQAYTKVPDFAWAFGDTGLKINLSLIAKGVDDSGRLIFDDVEGMPIAEAMKLRDRYSANVGTILVVFNDAQLFAAMADNKIDFIIPFHRSQWKKSQYKAMGLPAKTKDYTYMQNEKFIKPQYHAYRGRLVKDKATNYMPNEYWDFSKSGKENAEAYLEMCSRNNKRPKFYRLLQNNGDGSYSLKADGSTDGYWKLLIDFKMYDNEGNGSPQMPVKPLFNMEEAGRMLNEYQGGHRSFPVAQGIVDDFLRDYKNSHADMERKKTGVKTAESGSAQYSDRDYSYEALTAKKDMVVTTVSDTTRKSRADVVAKAKKNAAKIGHFDPKTGSVSVYVKDIDTDVMLPTAGLRHGLDRRFHVNAPITLKAGEIIQNSIRINEMKPKNENASGSYVLIGTAQNASGELYVIRSVVNRFSNELTSMDVLYAINAKKGNQSGLTPQGSRSQDRFLPGSTISISNLLDYVNRYFPDILPEDVLRHYGHEARPAGKLGESALFQERQTDFSPRELLANALETAAANENERRLLQRYKAQAAKADALALELQEQRGIIYALAFKKGRSAEDNAALTRAKARVKTLETQLTGKDKILLNLEATAALKQVLTVARKDAIRRTAEAGRAQLQQYRENQRAKAYIDSITHKAVRLAGQLTENSQKHHVPEVLKRPLSEFLQALDFSSERRLRGGSDTQKDKYFAVMLDNVRLALQKVQDGQTIAVETDKNGKITKYNTTDGEGYLDLPDGFIKEMDDFRNKISNAMPDKGAAYVLRRMSTTALQDLNRMLTVLSRTVSSANQFFANRRYAQIDAAAKNTIEELEQMGHKSAYTNKLTNFINWSNVNPVYAFDRFGEGGKAIFKAFQDGWGKLAFHAKEILDFAERTYGDEPKNGAKKKRSNRSSKQVQAWVKTVRTYHVGDRDVQLTDAQVMSLYCLARREQAMGHLLGGGFQPADIQQPTAIAKKTISQDAVTLYAEDIGAITAQLTDRQKQVADAMQEFMAKTCADWGNEVSMQRFGYMAFGEEYYFPIQVVQGEVPAAHPGAEEHNLYRLLNMSMTKSTVQGANNTILLRDIFDVFAEHTTDMAKYNALGLPLLDAMKWLNYKEKIYDEHGKLTSKTVQKSLVRAYGNDAYSYILNLLKDLNGTNNGGYADLDRMAKGFLSRYKVAAVGANLRVVLLQPTAYWRAKRVLSHRSLLYGARAVHRIKYGAKMAKQYCGMAVWKSLGYFDTNIARSLQSQIKYDAGVLDKIADKALLGAGKADEATWGALWNACEAEVKRTDARLKAGSEAFYRRVAELLTDVIYRTQVVDSTLTRSQSMRGKSAYSNMASAFMSEPILAANLLLDSYTAVHNDRRKGLTFAAAIRKNGRRVLANIEAYALSVLVSALIESLYDAWRDEDDDAYWEKVLEALPGNAAENLNPLNKIPLFKDIWTLISDKINGTDYGVERMDLESISGMIDLIDDIYQKGIVADEDKAEFWGSYRTVYRVSQALSRLSGVPLGNFLREVVQLYNNTVGKDNKMRVYRQESAATDAIEAFDKAFADGKATAKGFLDELIADKYAQRREEYPGESAKDSEKEVKASVQGSFTRYYKELYIAACVDGDTEQQVEIRKKVQASGLYDAPMQTCADWWESYKEEQRKKGK